MKSKLSSISKCLMRALLFSFINLMPTLALAQDATKTLPKNPTAIVTLLGTAGGPVIRSGRSQPAVLLEADGKRILVDCGDGTVQQLAKLGLQASDIDMVFLTHLHLDHTAGLASLLAFAYMSRPRPIQIFGPPGTKELVNKALEASDVSMSLFKSFFNPGTKWTDMGAATSIDVSGPAVVFQNSSIKVIAVENSHYLAQRPPAQEYGEPRSYSYRFEAGDRSIVFTGDTGPSVAVTKLANEADLLISEVIDPAAVMTEAAKNGSSPIQVKAIASHLLREHLTPIDVGVLGRQAKVKMIVLTHLALASDIEGSGAAFMEGVRESFDGPVVAGRDLDQF